MAVCCAIGRLATAKSARFWRSWSSRFRQSESESSEGALARTGGALADGSAGGGGDPPSDVPTGAAAAHTGLSELFSCAFAAHSAKSSVSSSLIARPSRSANASAFARGISSRSIMHVADSLEGARGSVERRRGSWVGREGSISHEGSVGCDSSSVGCWRGEADFIDLV